MKISSEIHKDTLESHNKVMWEVCACGIHAQVGSGSYGGFGLISISPYTLPGSERGDVGVGQPQRGAVGWSPKGFPGGGTITFAPGNTVAIKT